MQQNAATSTTFAHNFGNYNSTTILKISDNIAPDLIRSKLIKKTQLYVIVHRSYQI